MINPIDSLPDRIRIAGFDFTLEQWTNHQQQSNRRYGECSTIEQTIRVADQFSSPQKAVDTLLHECLHALFWAYGIQDKDDEERTIGVLGTALMTLHRDNPWLAPWIERALR